MLSPNSSLRTLATTNRLYIHNIEQPIRQEDTLIEIQPQLHDSSRPLTSPTQDTFEFPSLLECLSDHTGKIKMPPQDFFSDIDDGDVLDQKESLTYENQSDTISALSPLIADRASDDREQESTDDETDNGLSQKSGDFDDDTSTTSYSFDAIIQAAQEHYKDEIPPFCIRTSEQTKKRVQLSGGSGEAQILFRNWDDHFGYWILTDDVSDTYIVKYISCKYHVWTGVHTGFAKEPVACVLKPNDKKRAKPSSYQADEECDEISTPKGGLRPRTARQSMPYTMYNIQKKYDNRGVRLTESELEDAAFGSSVVSPVKKKTFKRYKQVNNSAANHRTDGHAPSMSSTLDPLPSSAFSEEDILSISTFRTRLRGFEIASIPLIAQSCPSNDALFKAMKQKWAFKLASQELAYCVATFPWLNADKNILLQENDSDAFVSMLDEIRYAPGLKTMKRVEVVIEIFVE